MCSRYFNATIRMLLMAGTFTFAGSLPLSAAGPEKVDSQTTAKHANFRVNIKVYESGDDSPIDEHLVLFHNGVVYDFNLIDTSSITVIDPNRGRIVLLNRKQEIRCPLKTDELTAMMAHLKVTVVDPSAKQKLGLSAEVQVDSETDTYSIQFDRVRYQTTIQATDQSSVPLQFAQFADWASRLNVARKRGLPPFARMSLNQSLADAGSLPDELTVELKHGLKKRRYVTRHEVVEAVSKTDLDKINEAGGMLALYRVVPLTEMP